MTAEPDPPQPALGVPRPCIPATGTHWWRPQALPGDLCLCGEKTWQRRRRGMDPDLAADRNDTEETR